MKSYADLMYAPVSVSVGAMNGSIACRWVIWIAFFGFGAFLGGRTGVTAERTSSPGLRVEVAFNKQGAPDGNYRLYDASGRLQITGEFQNGKRKDLWTIWDPGGGKRVEIMYRDGVKEGPCRMWYGSSVFPASAGQLKLEVTFAADKQNGSKRSWWANGKPRCETELDHGLIVSTRCWSESGSEFPAAKSIELARNELELDDEYLSSIDKIITYSIKKPLYSVPHREGAVTDVTATLSAAQKERLGSQLLDISSQCNIQLLVLIVPTTKPEPIEAYSDRVAESWAMETNWGLFVIAKEDRRLRIHVGPGLDHVVTDDLAKRIIDNLIVPRFRSAEFYEGISAGVEAVSTLVERACGLPNVPRTRALWQIPDPISLFIPAWKISRRACRVLSP